jgi:hypothetical protein
MLFAGACIVFGVLWDISWHSSIGRDTFWNPAHVLIHIGGVTAGLVGGWLAFDATFLHRERWRGRAVGVVIGRAPLGALVALWGNLAMLTSAPFDNWWHDTYGLDVKILSPPHMLLALGMYGVVTGALLLAASRRNQLSQQPSRAREWQVIFGKAIQLSLAAIMLTELSMPNHQHSAIFLLVSAALYPVALVASASEPGVRWPATKVALGFMLINLSIHWLLPLFPAEPKLAPIRNPVDHMLAMPFPLLLVFPALGIDLVVKGFRRPPGWKSGVLLAAVCSVVFVAIFTPIQWEFSRFMISPAADNWFFGGHGRFFTYFEHRGPGQERFFNPGGGPITSATIAWALVVGFVSSWLGRRAGLFASKIRR